MIGVLLVGAGIMLVGVVGAAIHSIGSESDKNNN